MEQVESFRYLGAIVEENGDGGKEIRARLYMDGANGHGIFDCTVERQNHWNRVETKAHGVTAWSGRWRCTAVKLGH